MFPGVEYPEIIISRFSTPFSIKFISAPRKKLIFLKGELPQIFFTVAVFKEWGGRGGKGETVFSKLCCSNDHSL